MERFKGISVVVDGVTYDQYLEMSGTYYYSVADCTIFATPFYEGCKGVPIEIIKDGGDLLNMEYMFIGENTLKEYENLIKMLITNILINS